MATASPPLNDRIAAASFTALAHALILALAIAWQASGSKPGSRSEGDATGETGVRVAVEFVDATPERKIAPKPDTAPEKSEPVPVKESPLPVPAQVDAGASAVASTEETTMDSSATSSSAGGDGTPDDLGARYLAAVRAAVLDKWNAQGGGAIPAGCKVVIDQIDGGKALRVWIMDCGALPLAARIRLETAVMQAQPLPYAGFETVFKQHLEMRF